MGSLISKAGNFFLHPDRRNFLVYSIGAFFLKGVSFFLIPMYTSLLSAAEFGSYDLLRTFGSVTEIILSLGLLQLIYVEFYAKDAATKKEFLSSFLSIYLTISGGLYLVLLGGLFFFSGFIFPGIDYYLVVIVILTTYLNFFQVMLLTVMKLSFQALRVTTLQVILGCTNLGLNILLVYGLRTGVDGIVISSLMVTILSCLYGMYYFRKQLSGFRIHLNREQFKNYLKLGLPFIPNVLSFWIMMSANRWILLHYAGIDEVGIYSVAFRLTAVFEPLIIEPFMAAYTPVILKRFKEGDYRQGFLGRTLIVPVIFILSGFAIQFIGGWVVGEEFNASLPLIIPLSIAYALNLIAQSSGLALIHGKMVRLMLWCVLAGSVSGVILNFILVPDYGAMGSAIATVAGHAVWALLVTMSAVSVIRKLKTHTLK